MLNNSIDFQSQSLFGKIVTGVVVDNNDPMHYGRLKVRVPDLLPAQLEDQYLPWVESWQFRSSVNGQCNINVPDIGSNCRILYMSDDVYNGVYISGLPNLSEEFLEDYPNTYGYIDRSGSLFLANTKTDTYTIYHVTGTKLTLEGNGHCTIQVASTEAGPALDIQVIGNTNITCQEDINIKGRNINMESNNFNVKSNNIKIEGNNVEVNAGSSNKIQSKSTMKVIGGSSLDLTSTPKLDGKAFGMYEDTTIVGTVSQFYAFSISGSSESSSAGSVNVKSPQVTIPEPRERQANSEEQI